MFRSPSAVCFALCATLLSSVPIGVAAETTADKPIVFDCGKGKYEVSIDTTGSPQLRGWAKKELTPVVAEWYPLIVEMLPGNEFQPPKKVAITISDEIDGVAYTLGNGIYCNGVWFQRNLAGEAKGAVVHELVHVVQQYRGRRGNRPPGWLVEGIADYIRWFLYEPESKGALIGPRRAERARHNASYRTSANFLNWVANQYGANFVPKLNARLRTGKYDLQFWSEQTGQSLEELAAAWKTALKSTEDRDSSEGELVNSDGAAINQLTDKEKEQGWKLLFSGSSFDGWHCFKRDEVLPGWQVKEGALVCQDPSQAGDLCTDDSFKWFELRLEYNISQSGNSGIMFHVTDQGGAAWATGPEFQLEDNLEAHDPTRCGWLYALYQPPNDPDTGQPIDATKPAGQWNEIRLLIAPDKCLHEINGVKYFEYQLDSDDFRKRVAASKFSKMPRFAKSGKGMIALQGDHGLVSFRNIKIRRISE